MEEGWELALACREGDPFAFREIVRSYAFSLRSFILRRARSLLKHTEIEDILQEVWYAAFRRIDLDDYDLPLHRPFLPWLRGLCLNVFKLGKSRAWYTTTEFDHFGSNVPDPGELASRLEERELLRECESCFSERELVVYRGVIVNSGSLAGVARELGCDESYVRKRLLPAVRSRLARCLRRSGVTG